VSGGWYRLEYGELSGKRSRRDALPVLEPDQVVRRAQSVGSIAGEPAACASIA